MEEGKQQDVELNSEEKVLETVRKENQTSDVTRSVTCVFLIQEGRKTVGILSHVLMVSFESLFIHFLAESLPRRLILLSLNMKLQQHWFRLEAV